jgi:hypothetical protein
MCPRWLSSLITRRRKQVEQRILAVLRADGELPGLTVRDRANLSTGAFYVAAHRMEEEGLIGSRWGAATAERGWKRQRLYFTIWNGPVGNG